MVSNLTFKYFINFEFISVCDISECLSFYLLHVCPGFSTPFVEEMQSNFLLTWSTKLVHFTLMKSTNFKLLKFAHAKLTRSQSDLMPLGSLSEDGQ